MMEVWLLCKSTVIKVAVKVIAKYDTSFIVVKVKFCVCDALNTIFYCDYSENVVFELLIIPQNKVVLKCHAKLGLDSGDSDVVEEKISALQLKHLFLF